MSHSAVPSGGLYERGAAQLAAGDVAGAISSYRAALNLGPPSAALWNNLGTALIKAGNHGEAIAALESALALEPGYRRALVNLGKALREIGRPVEAVRILNAALRQDPDYVPALVNLGEALATLGELVAAETVLERAIERAPRLVEAHMTLAVIRSRADRHAEALASLDAALAIAPEHADLHTNLAHVSFTSGDWRGAWPHFEYRFRRSVHRAKLASLPGDARWNGATHTDGEVWLLGEQGLGDQLQFARYARAVRERGMRCVLVCDPRLVALLSQARLADRVVPLHEPFDAAHARWFPLMSLPAWHATTPETVPSADGYLVCDPRHLEHWRARLGVSRRRRVGLVWAGNPRMETGSYAGRSPQLGSLAPLFTVPDVEFLSLQKGSGEEQLDQHDLGRSVTRLPGLDEGPDAFLDTAAVLRCVDLLITSDTATAHLAGALGVPTWLCLMRYPDWRWLQEGTETPWYRSMRLFRQRSAGDWGGVYREVAAALAALRGG